MCKNFDLRSHAYGRKIYYLQSYKIHFPSSGYNINLINLLTLIILNIKNYLRLKNEKYQPSV
ncbi:hypothetical protein BpHYR1_047321 [Brachionus plicatilis]|uniref:Uncharacterized protein n=1 Tax=Brachionus plicatilis TaxID=10195 RepID=A0A3M7RP36_BRAPC|nr:hypothetical protein BpHYR1_047321 [Brachionus plicatilis]